MKTQLYKHIIHILYTVSAVAAMSLLHACTNYEYRRDLLTADSIMAENPEKAVAMLDSMRAEMPAAPEHERMLYELLRIKAADKTYITHKSDSTIIKLVDYYEDAGDTRFLPEAYYYAGSIYRDLNDAPRAIDFYQKAEDKLNKSKNYRLLSNINTQKGYIFSKQYLYKEALQAHFKAYKYDSLLKDTVSIIYSLRNIAYIYKNKSDIDSSFVYLNKALVFATKIKNKSSINDIKSLMGDLYILKKDYNTAWDLLKPALSDSTNIEKKFNYNKAIEIYMQTKQYDSAYIYSKRLLNIGTIYGKQTASECLANISIMRGDYADAARYIQLTKCHIDSILKITATESVGRMNALYNYTLREKENLELKAESASRLNTILSALFIIITISIVLFIYVITSIRKSKEQMKRFKRMKKELYKQSEAYINENKAKIAELKTLLAASVNQNKIQAEQIEQQKNELILTNKNSEYKQSKSKAIKNRLTSTTIYRTITKRVKANQVLHEKEWETLDKTINDEIENFNQRIKEYHNVSIQEYRICMLIRIGIPIKDMAVIMSLSASGISKARTRLQEKFFGKEGSTKDFDSFVNSL